jgi:hypothetical protein
MRTLRSRLVVFALGVVVCQSAALLAAPVAICCEAQAVAATAEPECECDGAGGLCPMHHKDNAQDPQKPAHGARSCSGCADSSEMVFLTMTGPTAPIVAPFRLFTLQPETAAAVVIASFPFTVDRPPSAPPPKA